MLASYSMIGGAGFIKPYLRRSTIQRERDHLFERHLAGAAEEVVADDKERDKAREALAQELRKATAALEKLKTLLAGSDSVALLVTEDARARNYYFSIFS